MDFVQHLKYAFAMGINSKIFNGLEVLALDFQVGVIGNKVLVVFIG